MEQPSFQSTCTQQVLYMMGNKKLYVNCRWKRFFCIPMSCQTDLCLGLCLGQASIWSRKDKNMSLGGFNSFRTLSLVFLVAAEGLEVSLCTGTLGWGLFL